jgi:uncharacterized protein YprB with RNaseH-like and TPR domain
MLLSGCIKPLGKKTKKFWLKPREQTDKRLTREILDELNNYDIILTWYGKRYDIPFMKTRALKHGLEFIDPRIKHIDLYDTAKHKLRMHSNRLEAVADFLGIHGKTKISPDAWNLSVRDNTEAMKEVVYHNVKDVEVLEFVYDKLKREVTTISRV